MMDKEKLNSLITAITPIPFEWVEHSFPPTLLLNKKDLNEFSKLIWSSPSLFFDQLSCITGIDNGPEAGTMELIYTLYSIPFNQSILLKVILPRKNPEAESVSAIWKSAEWLEREIFDMYGIRFSNHPDLRRILMPADWEGYPLLKDYKEQETYRDIKLAPES